MVAPPWASASCPTPSLAPATNFSVGDGPLSVAIGDFNGDGKLDLAVANYGSDNVNILLGDGSGGLGAPAPFSIGDRPSSVAVGDFNGDGRPDLAVTNYLSDNVSVLLNTCNTPPVALCQNVSVNACGRVSASIDHGSSDPDGDAITLSQSPAGPYGLGTTSVTLTVTDSHGATNSCTGTVTVEDLTAPTITCPSNQTATATSSSGAAVSFAPTAADNCGTVMTSCTPTSGSTCPIGTTGVTCTATDGAGLQNSCGFNVTVTATALMQTTALIATVDGLPVPPAVKLVLKAPLLVAKVALQNNRPQIACGSLRVFEGIVEQLRRANKLTTAQATQLTTASQSIRTTIGCP